MKSGDADPKFDLDAGAGAKDLFPDATTAGRPPKEFRRVNVDFPVWMVEALDREAQRLGVTRQSVIKVWIAERLEPKAG